MAFVLPRFVGRASPLRCQTAALSRSLSSGSTFQPKSALSAVARNSWAARSASAALRTSTTAPWRRASTLVAPLQLSSNFFTSAFNPSYAASPSVSESLRDTPAPEADAQLPPLSGPAVTRWLFISASLVFAIVVVGGVTRLTESGLSIVEWRPITGTLPPLSQAEWEEEFEKYKTSPEFKTVNHAISLDEFKNIFFWEYTHRLLGRVIGVAFVAPLAYFALRKRSLTQGSIPLFSFLALLIGGQGALGWYMVKSGLRDEIITNKEVPRVSQYRLAAHLSMALALYVGMLSAGFRSRNDWRWANEGTWNKLGGAEPWTKFLNSSVTRGFRGAAFALTCLVFSTAFSGAFVAGLDAGLIYNEFPTMGGGLIPPSSELMSPFYARAPDHSDLWWRNIFENPTTVQFDHRAMGITTYTATGLMYLSSLHPAVRAALPAMTRHLAASAFGMANIQVLLGISTLLYLVPVPLAAAHQAGSVLLLTTMVAMLASLRRPGRAAQLWRKAKVGSARGKAATQGFRSE